MMLANDKEIETVEQCRGCDSMDCGVFDKKKADREAKRIACIAESMNIIRTLNSNGVKFIANYTESDQITFHFTSSETPFAKSLLNCIAFAVAPDGRSIIYLDW